MTDLKRTPLFKRHQAAGAKMAPFAGWEMPLHYGSQLKEHEAVRGAVGMFDVSHMGQFLVEGEQALELLQRWTTNDVARLDDGQSCYSILCNDDGGIIDDVIVSCKSKASGRYFVVVNAACIEKDFARLNELKEREQLTNVATKDISDTLAMIALQGPDVESIIIKLMIPSALRLSYFGITETTWHDKKLIVSRTGYTGEDGFELMLASDGAADLWDALLEAGVQPCGLAARDTLRLEAGYLLSGQDMDVSNHPLESGVRWAVKLKKETPFAGSEAVAKIKDEGTHDRFTGFVLTERGIPRHGLKVVQTEGEPTDTDGSIVVGTVTSGTFSPTLKQGIALARVSNDALNNGKPLYIDLRGKLIAAEPAKPPFIKESSIKKN
jgi:aminomethyltransferase